MVDTYFEIRNDNNKVVIDDTYVNQCFVHFSDIITVNPEDEYRSGSVSWNNISSGSLGKYWSYSRVYTLEELGLLTAPPRHIGVRRVDSQQGSYTMVAVELIFRVEGDSTSGVVAFRYRIHSMDVGAQYQIVSFTHFENLKPSTAGLVLYNADGKVVFDAELGYMQVMDSQYHLRDLYSSATQSFPVYNSHLPDLDFSRMFVIALQRPYATTGGTIIINHRQYVPRLRKDTTGQIYVDLGMWGATGGTRLQQYQRVFSFLVAYVHF